MLLAHTHRDTLWVVISFLVRFNDHHRWDCPECMTHLNPISNWFHQAGFYTSYMIWRMLWCFRYFVVSFAVARPQWYRFHWSVLQVSHHVTRLHTQKMLIFLSLVAIFLADNIFQRSGHCNRNEAYINGWAHLRIKHVHKAHWWIPEAFIFSGTYQRTIGYAHDVLLATSNLLNLMFPEWSVLSPTCTRIKSNWRCLYSPGNL